MRRWLLVLLSVLLLASGLVVAIIVIRDPGGSLEGAEAWAASDCTDDVPIVVSSDARDLSDFYGAVTLAGVLGTDCVILAGPRDGDMPADQRERLDAAAAGGYVIGGPAAIPAAKIAGREMTRLSGSTRWTAAEFYGNQERAVEDATAGVSGETETGTTAGTGADEEASRSPEPTVDKGETLIAVSAGSWHSCGLRGDGSVVCWGD
ncbi:MAG: hypothetical protein F4190_13700, partial [Acidimicrobiales bacterium]|nr:hypothetical protein [Acidimicrobiales bacterium]